MGRFLFSYLKDLSVEVFCISFIKEKNGNSNIDDNVMLATLLW